MQLWIKAIIIGIAKLILSLLVIISCGCILFGILYGIIAIIGYFGTTLLTTYPVLLTIIIALTILVCAALAILTLISAIVSEYDNLKKGQ